MQKKDRIVLVMGAILVLLLIFSIIAFLNRDNEDGIFHRDPNAAQTPSTHAVTKTFQIGEHPFLLLKGRQSNVDVHAGATGSMTVQARLHNSNAPLDPNTASIRYEQSTTDQGHDQLSIQTDPAYKDIDYTVTVPPSSTVHISVDDGSISVSGVAGVKIDTGSGGLHIDTVTGPITARTDSGDIILRDSKGTITINGQSGSLRMTNVIGLLQATTQSGDVVAHNAHLSGNSLLKTTNGSVRFDGLLDPQGTYRMQTTSGDVNVALPADAAFQLSATTTSGTIHNDFGGDSVGSAPRRPPLTLTVTNGSINLTQQA